MKNMMLWGLAFLLSGCASAYQLSKEGQAYRDGLDETRALEVVRQNIVRSAEQEGVCSAHTFTQFVQTRSPEVLGTNLAFTTSYTVSKGVYSTRTGGSLAVHSVAGETREGKWKADLKNLNKIRVLDDPKGFGCHHAKAGHIVMVGEAGVGEYPSSDPSALNKAAAIMIHVSPKNLDRLVAALAFLSPKAALLHGAGL